MRRWLLPPGSATFVFTAVAAAMSALTSFDLAGTILAALVGGLCVDACLWFARRLPVSVQMFLVAAATAFGTWPLYFVIVNAGYGGHWPVDFYLGAAALAALMGLVLAFFAGLPVAPADDYDLPPKPAAARA